MRGQCWSRAIRQRGPGRPVVVLWRAGGTAIGGGDAVNTTIHLYVRLTGEKKSRDFGRLNLGHVPKAGDEIMVGSEGQLITVRVGAVYPREPNEHGAAAVPNVYADEI